MTWSLQRGPPGLEEESETHNAQKYKSLNREVTGSHAMRNVYKTSFGPRSFKSPFTIAHVSHTSLLVTDFWFVCSMFNMLYKGVTVCTVCSMISEDNNIFKVINTDKIYQIVELVSRTGK